MKYRVKVTVEFFDEESNIFEADWVKLDQFVQLCPDKETAELLYQKIMGLKNETGA